MQKKQPRRHFVKQGLPITLLGSAIGLPDGVSKRDQTAKRKMVVFGAHPDDPETMCGGAMALFSQAGHEVVAAYLTRGEAGIPGTSHTEAAGIRTAEAKVACDILGVRPEIIGQIDGSCEITHDRYTEVSDFLKKEDPELIITHWPIDTHRDHRICSVLVYDAWLATGRKAALYYGEVMTGNQSQNFTPTDYLDITPVVAKKHAACFAHRSQKIEDSYADDHGKMEMFRGLEFGYQYAEAFVRHVQSPAVYLK